ncbi:hypothetical protein OSSY52_17170 [Tepiditoga spiralis]|uniref:DUF218 domain-containing protein n=1 Tax=Tepiditoga spiralis TaxID=2108365 RepID=A0A7G1G852_9BACT|nr:YdcF family protein [Tepiditoga spiralis]BBE31576.1 hypothetical protein OSSY52_17170 [Tepiditoga spiralis]
MFFYKVIGSFFEIPGIFVLLCILMFIYYLKKEKKIRKFLLFITLIIYIISSGWFSKIFIPILENQYSPFIFEGKSFENEKGLIVILGGGVISNTPNNNLGELSDSSMQRVYNGYLMYKNLNFPIIVTGGTLDKTDNIPEAFKMKEVLLKMGVKPSDVYLETSARNTYENAKFTSEIAKKLNKEKIYLVTSAIHMKRSYEIFKKYINKNTKLIPVPVNYLVSRTSINWYDFLPKIDSLKATSYAFHELLGILFEKIFS